jgi:heme-degrading monooxygenase HmoA
MVARVTLAEIDVMRMGLEDAVEIYSRSVIPAQHEQDGYEGGYVLTTPEGKALVITFWRDQESGELGMATGFYDEQVRKFVTMFRSPPGREIYDVALAETPRPLVAES